MANILRKPISSKHSNFEMLKISFEMCKIDIYVVKCKIFIAQS